MRIAVIGCRGFVGEAIFSELKKGKHQVIGVTRETYEVSKEESFDTIVNSAMPSRRYWAQKNPMLDFDGTVKLTADILYTWNYGKFIQISTVSARCQVEHPYGLNKLAAECLVLNKSRKNLVVRLGGLYGKRLDKGAVYDILNNKEVFGSPDSKYNYISVENAAKIITDNLNMSGIIEVGARDQISLKEIADHLGKRPNYCGSTESQYTMNPGSDYPSAYEILDFIDEMVRKK